MIFSLKFVYQDNKDLTINIAAEKMAAFFSALNQKQMYFDETTNMGFWTDLDRIRYVQAFQIPQQGEANDQSQAPSSDIGIPVEDAAIPCCQASA